MLSAEAGDIMSCFRCGRACTPEDARTVDGEPICLSCLYGDVKPVLVYPIGVVKNDRHRNEKGFGTSSPTRSDTSEIHLHPGMAPFMKGLEDESHLVVVWQTHRPRGIKTIFARGWDGKRVGPFASRTPDRLSPIAITEVALLEAKGTVLSVRGLDAINGTPVLDIKMSLSHPRKKPHK